MPINGRTKVYGLLANPVVHTISPFIHELLYDECNYNGTYNPYLVPTGKVKEAIEGMKALSIEGLNVTVPYKVEVMKYIDEIDEMAEYIGACNTIVRKVNEEGKVTLKGYNTDWFGLKMACDYGNIPIKDKDIVIIGAGGSSRAVAFMCQNEGAKSLLILNRTVSKAEAIAGKVQKVNALFEVKAASLEAINLVRKGSVVFQTTSLGMYPNIDKSPIINDTFLSNVDFIVDIIYNPKETYFMKKGKEFGVITMNGLGMLFFQAVKAFELWSGITMDKEQLDSMLKKLDNYVYTNNI